LQLNPRTVSQAVKFGSSIYELILSNWGNRGSGQDPTNGSIQFPPEQSQSNGNIPIIGQLIGIPIQTLFAISIAPRSDWDRCILRTASDQQPQQLLPPANQQAGFINQGSILETEQVLGVHDPLIGQLQGPTIVRANQSGWYSDTYVPAGQAATTLPFGTALGNPPPGSTGGPIWYNPELRLFLYLTAQAPLPPSHRAPFHHEYSYVFATAGTQQLTKVVPMMGRSHVRVSMHAHGSGMITPVLTGTFHETVLTSTSPTVTVTEANYEVPLVTGTALNSATEGGVVLAVDHPGVSYLLVNATGTVIGDVLHVSIDAFD